MAGSTIRRRQLGAHLRQLRNDAGDNRDQIASVLGCSPTKVTYLESGRNVIGKTELIVLLQHYGAEEKLEPLEELRQEANKRGWWSTARLPEWLADYVGLETEATSVRSFELTLIPGLLQTEEYARDLHTLRRRLTTNDIERRITARIRRQARLVDPDPVQLSAVVCEEALHRCVHRPDLATAQLRHLLDQARLPSVRLQVLPLGLGTHCGMAGAFTLLTFPDGLLPDVAWQEYAMGGHIIDDQSSVTYLARLYDELRSQALDPDESLAVIAEFVDQTR